MKKTILITGATDGIGLQAAQKLAEYGHTLLIHGRNPKKIKQVKALFAKTKGKVYTYQADFSDLAQVKKMAAEVKAQHSAIDVVINNAGVLKSSLEAKADAVHETDKIDIRFRVNTLAPYILTRLLMSRLSDPARVVNIASAAQAPFDLAFLQGKTYSNAMQAYSESKLALIAWTFHLAERAQQGVQFMAINPGSLLATKMVRDGFGLEGKDASIGSNLLVETALGESFSAANGLYFDNDIPAFAKPNEAALNSKNQAALVEALNSFL